jgi:hypothetical protein
MLSVKTALKTGILLGTLLFLPNCVGLTDESGSGRQSAIREQFFRPRKSYEKLEKMITAKNRGKRLAAALDLPLVSSVDAVGTLKGPQVNFGGPNGI